MLDLTAQIGGEEGLLRLLFAVALLAARLVPVFTLAPFFGGRLLPQVARMALALAFAALLLPSVGASVTDIDVERISGLVFVGLVGKEIAVGVVLGFLVALPFYAADMAGRLADMGRGASMAEVLVPQTSGRTSPLGDLALQLSIVVFLLLGGHLMFFRGLAASYEALPIVALPSSSGWIGAGHLVIAATAHMIGAAVALAAPALAATFLADLGLGLLNRVSPQIQVYFVGMPVKAVLGILVFSLALASMVHVLESETLGGLSSLRGAAGTLGR